MEKNLTTGSVFKTIVAFSLPFLLSYFLQILYGMADLFIVGQYNGVDSITAVSIGSQVMHFTTVIIISLAMGTTVLVARAIGAQQKEQASRIIGNTITMFMGLSGVITLIALTQIYPVIEIMATPAESVVSTADYLLICFLGVPFIGAYNVISAIFRGLGDTKSPMYFVTVACITNIALDYLFIGSFAMGAAGAALATSLSQAISVLTAIWYVKHRQTNLTLSKADFIPQKEILTALLKIGVPVACQDGFIQITFIIITIIANQRGLIDAAAVGIVEKIICLLFIIPSTMLSTVSALAAQNLGASKPERAKATLYYSAAISVAFGILSLITMQLYAEQAVALFTSDAKVILAGGEYMRGYVWDCVFAGVHFCFSGYFCAYGLSTISFLHNFISIVFARVPLTYLASIYYPDTLFPMGLATTTGSILSIIICVIVFYWMEHHKQKHLFVPGKAL